MATDKELRSGITAEWLRDNLVYVPETGVFMWRVRGQGRNMDRAMGTTVWPGYHVLKLQNEVYYAHRVAWFYVHVEWPSDHLDHIDGDRSNNAIANLRIATPAQNVARRETKRRIAPSRGVFPHGVGFVARIHYAGKRHYLGYFSTLEAARAVYEAKAREIHGEFAHVEHLSAQDAAVAEAVKRGPHRDWLLVATPGFGGAGHG